MCGIIGYVGGKRAAPILLDALQRLEYRGYDSAGIATITSDIQIKKDAGKIAEIHKKHNLADLSGAVGIAHTRWSTHGRPSLENAHPHVSCDGKIAVVHNGIIENYAELRQELKSKGHRFVSETDTEVLPHLVEEHIGTGFENAVRQALKQVKGSFAAIFMNTNAPDTLIAARHFSPLVLGVGEAEYFAASDVPAFLSHTNQVIYVNDGEYAVLDKTGIQLKSISSGKPLKSQIKTINWDAKQAEKSGYKHFTLKEIHEQPEALAETLRGDSEVQKAVPLFSKMDKLYILACGTSYHAGLVGKYLFEKYLKIPTEVVISSEFKESAGNVLDPKSGVLAISQSGETADTLSALRLAKAKGARAVALTNVLGSSITRECDHSLYTFAGPEIGVVATKTFITQLAVLYMLVNHIAREKGQRPGFQSALQKVPLLIQEILKQERQLRSLVEARLKRKGFYFIGRGLAYPVALEGALKLKEISYIHAEGFAAGELKHGPLALIEPDTTVFAIAPKNGVYDKTVNNINEVEARGADTIVLTDDPSAGFKNKLIIPTAGPDLAPLTYIVPLQLIAYYAAVLKGLDPDKPRNLAKSVTVE